MLKRNSVEPFILVLTGMTIGAAVAVLFAPESGAKTRRRLRKYALEPPRTFGKRAVMQWKPRRIAERNTSKQVRRRQKEAVQTAAETLKENLVRRTGIL